MKSHILTKCVTTPDILIGDGYGHFYWLRLTRIVTAHDLNPIQEQGKNQPPRINLKGQGNPPKKLTCYLYIRELCFFHIVVTGTCNAFPLGNR